MQKLIRFDWAIKYILRNKANFDILEGFLSELLKTDIKIENILESESNKETPDDKSNRVDLLVKSGQKERILIEVQCSSQWDYLSRILYGTSKALTEHIHQGEPYRNLCKIISVSIVFFNLGDGKDYLYNGKTSFKGLHYHDDLRLGPEEMKIYGQDKTPSDIMPEYYIIKVNQFNERIKSKLDEWIYFLKNERIESNFNAKGIQSAAKKLDILRLNEKERSAYECYQEQLHQDASMALPYDVGRAEGKVEGRTEGLIEGEKKGKAEGLAEALLLMLEQKFKTVPKTYHYAIEQADPKQLREWLERTLKYQTIKEVMEDEELVI